MISFERIVRPRRMMGGDWSGQESLTQNGSNQFNLAKIVVDEERDLAIVVATSIGGPPAHDGVERVVAELYARFR